MAKTSKVSFVKREKFKKVENSKEKTNFKKSLKKEDFDNDEAFSNFKAIKRH